MKLDPHLWHIRNLLYVVPPPATWPTFLDVSLRGEPSVLAPRSMEGGAMWKYHGQALCRRQVQELDGTVHIAAV